VIKTTSQLISLHAKLEEEAAEQLRALAQRSPGEAEALNRLADENIQHKDTVARVYREGVTDAFEVGYMSKPLDEGDYAISELEGPLKEAVRTALRNEDAVIRFCLDASRDANQLIPSLPQTFSRLAKRKEKRKALLESLV
jgi:rubrerythrin